MGSIPTPGTILRQTLAVLAASDGKLMEFVMKINTKPPREIPMKTQVDFNNASRDVGTFAPTVLAIETSEQHRALIKMLDGIVRPYAVCVLRVK